jgi:hypothetical protein
MGGADCTTSRVGANDATLRVTSGALALRLGFKALY